jgi:dephospho-CoA kinase
MLKVGLTGGIGSGKSTAARIFEVLGIPVYYADEAAKSIMNEDARLQHQIIHHFGPGSYTDGKLNRGYLSKQVFNDPEKLELLNSLVHPATIRMSEQWMEHQTGPYAIKEAALIFESGTQQYLDYVIGVYAPQPLRILRTMKRDGVSREEVLKRMSNQIEEDIKMRLCDFTICNDEQKPLLPQVLELHKKLLMLAGNL